MINVRLIILVLCLVPVLAGLTGAILPATGWFPPLGSVRFSTDPLLALFEQPGLWRSCWLSVTTALLSTFIAYWLAVFLLALCFGRPHSSFLFRLISPLLSVPHITIAVGFLFLLQPSGWLARLLSPWLTGWERPPLLNLVPDENGLVLIAGLVAKELPFLLLMGLSALNQIRVRPLLEHAASLGYGPLSGWFHLVMPQLYPRLRLAVLIVLVFAVSVVDMAIILAPTTPAPLAVRILIWFRDPDLSYQFIAASAALLQLVLALLCCGIWMIAERQIFTAMTYFSAAGWRFSAMPSFVVKGLKTSVIWLAVLPVILAVMGMAAALLWAFADIWRYPDALPQKWGLASFTAGLSSLFQAAVNSLILGLATAILCVITAIIWLQARPCKKSDFYENLIYIPLLLPQAAFLFGVQILLIWIGFDGFFVALIWSHSLFVFPYVMLSLSPSWRRFDVRYIAVAQTLGAGPVRRFFRVRMAMMLMPILTAFAVGFAVSSALYLPTIFASNGRIITLTTEAVTMAAGAGRQNLGIASLMQMFLPLSMFLICDFIYRLRLSRFSYFKI